MSKTKYVLLKEPVTFNGAIVEAEEVVELGALSAKALIDEGKAVEVTPDAETGKALEGAGSPGSGDNTDPHQVVPSEPKIDPENDKDKDLELTKKALNDKFNRDPLAEEAKAVGVEFPYDAKKGEIIQAVIEAGKAEVLLEK